MNKQKNRMTNLPAAYNMPVDEFCNKYGLDIKVVMRRMNTLSWADFDALVIPQNLEDTPANKVRRALQLMDMRWDNKSIASRLDINEKIIDNIASMTDDMKNVFLKMDNYFFLDPAKVDLEKVFKEAC